VRIALEVRPLASASARGEKALVVASETGIARWVECGARAASLRHVSLAMLSARGAVEIVVHGGASAAAPLAEVLPQRARGPIRERRNWSHRTRPSPLGSRLERTIRSLRLDGARAVRTLPAGADERGVGARRIHLKTGCHRIVVLAKSAPRGVDVAAVLRGGATTIRDKGHAPDARLSLCLAEPRSFEVAYTGAASRGAVLIVDGLWPLPSGLPDWPEAERAAAAAALWRQDLDLPAAAPLAEAIGTVGRTHFRRSVIPGRCYLALAAASPHPRHALRLIAKVGGAEYRDEARRAPLAAALSFCADARDRSALFSVEYRGHAAAWRWAMWPLGASMVESPVAPGREGRTP
jgi:hypothetical protein